MGHFLLRPFLEILTISSAVEQCCYAWVAVFAFTKLLMHKWESNNGLMLLCFSTDTTLMSQRLQGNMQNISISLKELTKFDVIVQWTEPSQDW